MNIKSFSMFNESKMDIEDVKREIEIEWDRLGRKSKLVDFYEEEISGYQDKMKKTEYETLRDMIIFDWSDSGNDISPEYV